MEIIKKVLSNVMGVVLIVGYILASFFFIGASIWMSLKVFSFFVGVFS